MEGLAIMQKKKNILYIKDYSIQEFWYPQSHTDTKGATAAHSNLVNITWASSHSLYTLDMK